MIKLKIPATSANLGSGFDSIGMALSVYNYLEVEETDAPLVIETEDPLVPKDKSNLIYKSIEDFYDITGKGAAPSVKLLQRDAIPMARGLGSSAACVVGGLFAGNYLSKANLSREELISIAAQLEGHPDNSTPAIVGGITVGAMEGDKLSYIKIDSTKFEKLKIAVMTPEFHLKTEYARSVLPGSYSVKDAVFNLSRSALLIAAIYSGDYKKIKIATQDMLHQPYRMSMINNAKEIFSAADNFGALATFLSGSGPTLISITDSDAFFKKMEKFLNALPDNWTIKDIALDANGIQIL
jgi:homoserine kinase